MYEQLSEGESDEWHNSHGQTRRTAEKTKDGETCRRRQHQYEEVQDSISLSLRNKCALASTFVIHMQFYFKRNVWVSADPDEKSLPAMVDLCGSDRFMWASDFPDPDHTGDYIEELEEMVEKMLEAKRRNVLGDNVRRVYKLSA